MLDYTMQVRRVLGIFSVGVSFGVNSLGGVLECLELRGECLKMSSSGDSVGPLHAAALAAAHCHLDRRALPS